MTKKSVIEIPPVKRKGKNHPWVARNWRHREFLAAKKKKRGRK